MMVPVLFHSLKVTSSYCTPSQSRAHCSKQAGFEFVEILLPLLSECRALKALWEEEDMSELPGFSGSPWDVMLSVTLMTQCEVLCRCCGTVDLTDSRTESEINFSSLLNPGLGIFCQQEKIV